MSRPIDLLLSRLDGFKLRENGRDRWRACCPAHGGTNASTLSVGVGNDDAVLLKCWHGCDVEQIVGALGLELTDLFPPKPTNGHGSGPLKKRRLITDRQALDLLHDEAQLVALCAANIANGVELTDDDRSRVLTAAGRVCILRDEVMS
jgi:hypothetical protein